ncbi:MAG: sugar ABC transporter permease [Clostridia bacterium]|nr:sugar ABC transporter permease [Clostridia bacterium]
MSNKFSKLKSFLPAKRKLTLSERKARRGWFFVLPFVLGLVLLYLPIVVDSIVFSFSTIGRKMDPVTNLPYDWTEFVGLRHFKEGLNPSFLTSLGEGVVNLIWEVPAIVIFALFVAVILNQKMFGRAAFRAIFFVPVIISTGLMEAVNAAGTTADAGGIDDGTGAASGADQFISMMDVQMLFSNMKVGTGLVTYVIDLVNSIYDIVNFSGVQMLIFLAGLQSISPAIYEASRIDGASAWETFWKVTFPMVSPMIFVNAIYTIIDSFTRQSNVVMKTIQEIYDNTSENVATAQAWTYFLVVILIVAVFAAFASAFVFYQKRDS